MQRNRDGVARALTRYERLASDLRARIVAGDLAPGAPFPSRADLAVEHGDYAAREALRLLRDEGWIVTRVGSGATVADPLPPAPGEPLDVQGTLRDLLARVERLEAAQGSVGRRRRAGG